jgi:hypothetical protein
VIVVSFLLGDILLYMHPVICTFYYVLCNLSKQRKGKGKGKDKGKGKGKIYFRTGDKVSEGE